MLQLCDVLIGGFRFCSVGDFLPNLRNSRFSTNFGGKPGYRNSGYRIRGGRPFGKMRQCCDMDSFPEFMKHPSTKSCSQTRRRQVSKATCSMEQMEAKWHSGLAVKMRWHDLSGVGTGLYIMLVGRITANLVVLLFEVTRKIWGRIELDQVPDRQN